MRPPTHSWSTWLSVTRTPRTLHRVAVAGERVGPRPELNQLGVHLSGGVTIGEVHAGRHRQVEGHDIVKAASCEIAPSGSCRCVHLAFAAVINISSSCRRCWRVAGSAGSRDADGSEYFDYGIGLLSVRRAQLRAGRPDGVLGYRRWIDFSRRAALDLAAAEDFRSVAQCKTWAGVRVGQR